MRTLNEIGFWSLFRLLLTEEKNVKHNIGFRDESTIYMVNDMSNGCWTRSIRKHAPALCQSLVRKAHNDPSNWDS